MKTIKTLKMKVVIGLLYSASIAAQGNGWNFMYLAPKLEGVSIKYGRGKRDQAFDAAGNPIKLLEQYGPVRADTLLLDSCQASGYIPQSLDISSVNYGIIRQITNTAHEDRATFGDLLYDGYFNFNEFYFNGLVEITDNIQLSVGIPFFYYKFTNNGYVDLTPVGGNTVGVTDYNIHNSDWIDFLKEYSNILTGYGLKTDSYKEHKIGDLLCSLIFKDIFKSEKTAALDCTFGFVAPTGEAERLDHIFSVDYGHKKQWGGLLGLTFTSTPGDRLKFQLGVNAIFFKPSTYTVRMYTDENQSSFIKLAQGRARHNVGTEWNWYSTIELYAPHSPIHFLVGYSCNGQMQTKLYPEDILAFRDYIVNKDPKLGKWVSHTVFGELSFVKEMKHKYCEEVMIGVLADYPFAGKNTVKGVRYGGACGMVLKFDF